jgi:hypothetical protein
MLASKRQRPGPVNRCDTPRWHTSGLGVLKDDFARVRIGNCVERTQSLQICCERGALRIFHRRKTAWGVIAAVSSLCSIECDFLLFKCF